MRRLASTFLSCILLFASSTPQWIQQSSPSTGFLWKIRFADPTTGWIVSETKLYKTINGGQTWTPQDTVMRLGPICVLNSDVVFFCEGSLSSGQNRGIRKTTDGGATWRSVDTSRFVYIDVEFPTSQVGYAVGREPSSQPPYVPVIRKTSDGGETWQTIFTLNFGTDFEAVSFIDTERGWAITYTWGMVYHTTNGGSTWTLQDSVGIYNGTDYPMRDIVFCNGE